jgi:putative FmdB family regulatory protein
MPIMNFKCEDCGKEFTKIYFYENQAPRMCPVCGSANLTQLGDAFEANSRAIQSISCSSCDSCDSCEPDAKPKVIHSS